MGSKTEKELMYQRFLKAYAEAYPDYLRQTQFKNAQKLWNEVKNDPEKHDEMIRDFKKKAKEKEGRQLGKWANWFKKSTGKTTTAAMTTATTTAPMAPTAATMSTATATTSTLASAATSSATGLGAFTYETLYAKFVKLQSLV